MWAVYLFAFGFLFVCQQTNTKDIAGQSARIGDTCSTESLVQALILRHLVVRFQPCEHVCDFTKSLILNTRKRFWQLQIRFSLKLLKHLIYWVSNYCLLETLDVLTARLSTKTDAGAAVLISNNKILRDA